MSVILKSPGEIEAMKAAGQLSAEVLRKVGELVKPGVSTLELDEFAETYIREHGGIPAFKGYGGFPGTICASVNEQIVHGIPSKKVVLRDGDILSVDTGATVDGWVGLAITPGRLRLGRSPSKNESSSRLPRNACGQVWIALSLATI